ncbi:MAG: glycosyltransferase [Saprospiraceae bacterium]|nr:glycosyltransferase [Saprospiraceae bacterium]
MNILIVYDSIIPAKTYGGIERVVWCLGRELIKMNHKVTFLVKKGSTCPFANVLTIDPALNINDQIPADIEIVHFHFRPPSVEHLRTKYLMTIHGNSKDLSELNMNSVFVSKNHAARHNSSCYVLNGLDWDDYLPPTFVNKRDYCHFLGKAAWSVKNVKGAISISQSAKTRLKVIGGYRMNFNMGFRFTISPSIQFYGMLGGNEKLKILDESLGLIFPVRWHEPFGLAIIESLFYGCPVFATPYGSLPEIINKDVGFLSNAEHEFVEAIKNVDVFSPQRCHDYARDVFNSKIMANSYLEKYELVLSGKNLNPSPPRLLELSKEKLLAWYKTS